MKNLVKVLMLLVSSVCLAQAQDQSGIPAKITAANGKQFPVFLQSLEDGNINFELLKNPKKHSVSARSFTNIEFVGRFDVAAVEQLFNTGDYQGMIDKMQTELEPSVDAYWAFMSIENNYQDLFVKLIKANLRLGNASQAREMASIMMQSKNSSVKGQAESIGLLAALAEQNIPDAEALLSGIKSEAAKLYLGACIERAKGEIDKAFGLVCDLIKDYENDLDWMPQAELLSATLYLDLGMTNSAINTARQVKNIYAKSDIANDAAALQQRLVLAQEKAEADAKAKADAEAEERAKVKARALERAKGLGVGANDESDDAGTSSADSSTDDDDLSKDVGGAGVETPSE